MTVFFMCIVLENYKLYLIKICYNNKSIIYLTPKGLEKPEPVYSLHRRVFHFQAVKKCVHFYPQQQCLQTERHF